MSPVLTTLPLTCGTARDGTEARRASYRLLPASCSSQVWPCSAHVLFHISVFVLHAVSTHPQNLFGRLHDCLLSSHFSIDFLLLVLVLSCPCISPPSSSMIHLDYEFHGCRSRQRILGKGSNQKEILKWMRGWMSEWSDWMIPYSIIVD